MDEDGPLLRRSEVKSDLLSPYLLEDMDVDFRHGQRESIQCVLGLPHIRTEEGHRPDAAVEHPRDKRAIRDGGVAFLECDHKVVEPMEKCADEIAVF